MHLVGGEEEILCSQAEKFFAAMDDEDTCQEDEQNDACNPVVTPETIRKSGGYKPCWSYFQFWVEKCVFSKETLLIGSRHTVE